MPDPPQTTLRDDDPGPRDGKHDGMRRDCVKGWKRPREHIEGRYGFVRADRQGASQDNVTEGLPTGEEGAPRG